MKVERTTAAILNEPYELFGVPRFAAGIILVTVVVLFRYIGWKAASVAFMLLTLGVKELYKWDRDFLFLIPAIIFFYIHRVFDPFEWEPFQLVIVEDMRYEED
jgi:uncharacterized membrane protein YfhO